MIKREHGIDICRHDVYVGSRRYDEYRRPPDEPGFTTLGYAVLGNHPAVVAFLLGRDADVSLLSHHESDSPLSTAVALGHLGIARQLIADGANVDRRDSGLTALHRAVRSTDARAVRELLVCGADPDILDDEEFSAVDRAAINQDDLVMDAFRDLAPSAAAGKHVSIGSVC
jgi:ankyrin repeat protein